jgi:hypothetical protein
MNVYYVLRKANGDVLTIDVEGKEYIPVWESDVAIRRSKSANPDFVVYVPALLNRRLLERAPRHWGLPFYLVDSRDPDLQSGQEIGREEILGPSELAQAA